MRRTRSRSISLMVALVLGLQALQPASTAQASAAAVSAARVQSTARAIVVSSGVRPTLKFAQANMDGKTVDSVLEKAFASKPGSFAVETGHTLLFLLTVTGIEIVAHKIQKDGLSTKSLTDNEVLKLSASAAEEIVSSGDIWTSMAFAGAVSSAAQPAMKALAQILVDPSARMSFGKLLQTSIATSVGFIGWELGAQLWTEATLLLEDKADYERAAAIWSVGAGSLRSLLLTATPKDINDRRIAGLMVQNLLKVMLVDSKLTRAWFNNTWRTRVMTGGFSTMLGAMVASGAVGSAIFPGGGTFVGLLFGVLGAGASMVIPQWVKDDITYTLGSTRQNLILWKLAINAGRVSSSLKALKSEPLMRRRSAPKFTDEQRVSGLKNQMQRRREIRSDYETVLFEKAQLVLRYWSDSVDVNPEVTKDAVEYLGMLKDAELKFCRSEEKILTKPSETHADVQDLVKKTMAEEVDHAGIACDFVTSIFEEISAKLDGDRALLEPLFNYVDVNQKRGFSEDKLVEQWNKTE
jgi:hypothetical protein